MNTFTFIKITDEDSRRRYEREHNCPLLLSPDDRIDQQRPCLGRGAPF